MPRLSGIDRVRRMLAIVPWVAAQPDGATVDELCERFDVDRSQLVNDLATVTLVGVAPYTPDLLVEVLIEDDRVWVTLPVAFDRPFQLTADEGLALLVAGSSLLAVPGAEPDGPLARGLARIAGILGVEAGDHLHVELGPAEETTLTLLQQAIADDRQVQLDYYSYGRDEHATRIVDPHRVWSDSGQWYLSGYCHLAEDERVFRVDRVAAAEQLDQPRAEPASLGADAPTERFIASDATPRVTLELAPGARWVLDRYPIEDVSELDGGRVEVTIAVSAVPWLERLLLRLGPDARVTRADDGLAGAGPAAAARVLARYARHDG